MDDLISRESVLKKYCKEPAKGNCKQCDWYGDSWCRCEIFGTQIAEAPAVDAVEVKHGRWLKTKEPLGWQDVDCVECSCCHESWIFDEEDCFEDMWLWKHCPNCGAKMDGERKENG